jgi:hypothetical protein
MGVLAIAAAIYAVAVAALYWIARKVRGRTFALPYAFVLGAMAAYAMEFAAEVQLMQTLGVIPNNQPWPVFFWSGVAFGAIVCAGAAKPSGIPIAIPCGIVAALAPQHGLRFAEPASTYAGLLTAAIALVCLFLVPKQFTDKKQANSGISDSFTVGPYRLDDVIEDFTQLVEFSPAEYAQIVPKFKGEKDYNAPAVNFLGIMWAVQLGTVHGKIYKIAPYLLRATKYEANPIATNILRFCKDQLGVPAEQKTGRFVWDTSDGNVIFQTGEVNEGFSLALFLTSNLVKDLSVVPDAREIPASVRTEESSQGARTGALARPRNITEWNASADLMAKVRASIQPVQIGQPLRRVLTQDFPRDSSNLPISGGWGYTQADAIMFVRDQLSVPTDFASLEYHIVRKIIYEELIIHRPEDYHFSGIDLQLIVQRLIKDSERRYDLLKFNISCWSDWHWDQLKQEWEENDFGKRPGFDREAHAAKRDASRVRYEREFWFDITDVFHRG